MKRSKQKGFMGTMDIETWTPDIREIEKRLVPAWEDLKARRSFQWPTKPE